MRKFSTALAIAISMAVAPAAFGTEVFSLVGSAGGNPVDLEADFNFGSNSVTITIYNLGNVSTVAQNISGLFFTLSNGATVATLGSNSGTLVNCCSGNSFTSSTANQPTGWVVLSNVKPQGTTNGIELCDVNCGGAGPAHTIIGVPSSPGGSLTNGAHNPFIDGSKTAGGAVFDLSVSGVTSSTTVTAVYFGLGTTLSNTDFHAGVGEVPEPGTIGLVGLSLIGLGGLGWRRKKRG